MADKPKYKFILAHHSQEQCGEKCFPVGIRNFSVYVCSRCLGLYPVLGIWLAIDLSLNLQWNNSLRGLLFWIFILLPWSHWAREHYFNKVYGSRVYRTFTGVLAGLGLGIIIGGHLRHPYNETFTFSMLLLSVISGTVIFLRNFFRS